MAARLALRAARHSKESSASRRQQFDDLTPSNINLLLIARRATVCTLRSPTCRVAPGREPITTASTGVDCVLAADSRPAANGCYPNHIQSSEPFGPTNDVHDDGARDSAGRDGRRYSAELRQRTAAEP